MCLRLVGTTGYSCTGLPACKLRLRQDVQNTDLYFFEPMDTSSAAASAASLSVSSGSFFLDPEGKQKAELEDWLGLAMGLHGKGKPILPLFVNGQVKVGYPVRGWISSMTQQAS